MKKLETLVFEALGEASMCWSETPKGVFQDSKAKDIGDKLIDTIQALTSVKSESEMSYENQKAIQDHISKVEISFDLDARTRATS